MESRAADRPPEGPGGFFALRTTGTAPGSAVTLASLYAGDADPVLSSRIDRVGARLGARERRVAASVAQLGLAARLCSVALGTTVLRGEVPALDPATLWWDATAGSPDDLWLTAPLTPPRGGPGGPPEPKTCVEPLARTVCERHLRPLVAAVRRVSPVSERLLWGNAASALGGALGQLTAWCVANGRPECVSAVHQLTAALLDTAPLRGTATLRGATFRRRTCCLYYRAGGGLCGDCVFDTSPLPRRRDAAR
ncbi:(2Fe-2S)-binding protein [Streptomyces alkaliterrae]|uniref:(2Fe-2S)-binding protein n=1 Tax=Streptomyces alkaliterrae TaxID=2213162 RepID=A0A5P0YRW8_9ACTN|nr:(2Fe-2S)-binding protein [Streptomyces alkaliterrae]MBB1252929.1 (2Fe-2S)-binding protein [Streptomyces alkaliterrae]MBB1258356.1 (2Fe-2S)-binding protein [Streptomyces alkaliterrae]MQS02347.1 ferric iron reductase [Streptomyces alkaliterrae]